MEKSNNIIQWCNIWNRFQNSNYLNWAWWICGLAAECELSGKGQIEGYWMEQKQCRKINGLNKRIRTNRKTKWKTIHRKSRRVRYWLKLKMNGKKKIWITEQSITEKKTKKGKTWNHVIEFLAEVQTTLNNYAIMQLQTFSEPQTVWSVDTI